MKKVIDEVHKITNSEVSNTTVQIVHQVDDLVIIQITSTSDRTVLFYNYFKKGYLSVTSSSYIELINQSGVTIFNSLDSLYKKLI